MAGTPWSMMSRTFSRIRNECPRRLKDLKVTCEEVINVLSEKDKEGEDDENADPYFHYFQQACECKHAKIVEIALDGIHSLIEHGFLRGEKMVSVVNPIAGAPEPTADVRPQVKTRTLMDVVIETVSRCSDEMDDEVHLQVIKVLLTAVTSAYCEVHEAALLLAVKACFHIHLISKNQSNKTSVKAALTQMLSVVNVRMEICDAKLRAEADAVTLDTTVVSVVTQEDGGGGEGDESDIGSRSVSDEGGAKDETPSKQDDAALAFPSVLHKDSFLLFRAVCIMSMKANQDEGSSSSSSSSSAVADSIALPNKLLSLELILHVLQQSGPAFRSGSNLLQVIRNYLCVSLLRNCTSPVASVIGLSLHIFVALMEGFKDHLKSEMEVFVTNVFLRILESENSTYDHKLRVLEVFHSICRDPKALVELFINYDCDLDAIDLFRRIVDGFAKVSKNPSLGQNRTTVDFISAGKKALAEEHHLRMMGLEGLVIILRALLRSSGHTHGLIDDIASPNGSSATNNTAATPSGYLSSSVSPQKAQDSSEPADDGYTVDSVGAIVDTIPTNAVDTFDRKQRLHEEIETGILKFNLSSKKGLAYLAGLGHIEMTPSGVASFFHQYSERLDKTILGEYLGREREYENGFCLKVLHEYVDAMEFTNKPFDLAIRHFLSGFRLPGEAQKIDRLMEKFAERYYLQNKDVFASADMAFILAFSTIMLQTNLHNPAIKDKRMTKEQFLKQNKGISPDGELPEELLSEIYDRIAATPISMTQDEKFLKKVKKDDDSSFVVFQTSVDKRRKDAFNDERLEMVRAGEAMFKQKTKTGKAFVRHSTRSSDDTYVRPMFEVAWAPTLGVLSQILETYDEPSMVDLCLSGFQLAVRLASRLDFPVERSTYVNALSNFTALDQVREMRPKNIESIKTIIDIALSEGDYLEESWSQVLLCISQLARLQLFGNGLHTDDLFFKDNSAESKARKNSTILRSPGGADPFTKLFSGPSRAETARLVEEANALLVIREISPAVIDRIFINSPNLSAESVQHFVRSLCEVSLLEISASRTNASIRTKDTSRDASSPRIFSLQKLVEVADFNMHIRSRIAWTNIWSLLAKHFTAVAMYDNHPLAMYAIDSLKQLSIKFLQKEELSNFNFQRVFLKPFEEVISRARSPEIKDLILRCIDIMILACASNIRSGWRSIFSIFEAAAMQEKAEIATLAFDMTERLMLNQFELLAPDFVELATCFATFVASDHTSLSLRAIASLERCTEFLAQGVVTSALEHVEAKVCPPNSVAVQSDEDGIFRLWWPLLLGMASQVADPRLQVRMTALQTFSDVLNKYGSLFLAETWAVIFRGVLFPIIDSAKTDFTRQPVSFWPSENPPASMDRNSWIGTTGLAVLSTCIELYFAFRDKSDEAQLLPEILSLTEECICQETESLARIGQTAFGSLILSAVADTASEATINSICERLCATLEANLCLDFQSAGPLKLSRDTPVEVAEKMSSCPLAARRATLESPLTPREDCVDTVVQTPYGPGTIIEVIGSHLGLHVKPRKCVKLDWGVLYSQEHFPTIRQPPPPAELSSSVDYSSEPTADDWPRFAASAMTSMVVTLDFFEIMQEFCEKSWASLKPRHQIDLLQVVECAHWHARSFNEDQSLRVSLRARAFMRFHDNPGRLPNLLEQEVRSAALLARLAVKTFAAADASTSTSAASFVKRYIAVFTNRYMDLDDTLSGPNPVSADLVAAYKPAVVFGLTGLCSVSIQQFRECLSWLGPLLTRLISCHDRDVRLALQQVHATLLIPAYGNA